MRRPPSWKLLALFAGAGGLLATGGCDSDVATAQTSGTGNRAQTADPAPAQPRPQPSQATNADELSAPEIGGRPNVIQPGDERVTTTPPGFRTLPPTRDERANVPTDPDLIDDTIVTGPGYGPPVVIAPDTDQPTRTAPDNRQYFAPTDTGPQVSELYLAAQEAERNRRDVRTTQGRLQLLKNRIDRLHSMIVIADEVEQAKLRESLDELRAHYRAARQGETREHLRAADREWRQAMRVFRGA